MSFLLSFTFTRNLAVFEIVILSLVLIIIAVFDVAKFSFVDWWEVLQVLGTWRCAALWPS